MSRLLILFLLGTHYLFPNSKNFSEYFNSGIHKTLHTKTNRMILGTSVLGAAIASQFDNDFQKYAQGKGFMPESLARFSDDYVMDGWSIGLLTGGLALEHYLSDQSKLDLHRKLQYAFTAMAASTVITYGFKYGVGRERPNGGNNRSFPSGHTSHSFTIAAVSQELLGYKVGILAYAMAAVVGFSRIQDNKHYLSDVIFGAGIGTVIGRGFGMVYKKETIAASLQPTLDGQLKLSVRF